MRWQVRIVGSFLASPILGKILLNLGTMPIPDGSPAAQRRNMKNERTPFMLLPPQHPTYINLLSRPPPIYRVQPPGIPPPFPPLHERKKEKKETTTATNGSPQDGATLRDVVRKSCLTDTPYHPTLDNSQERPRWQWVWTTTVAVM
jgi:hypothetical protein